MQYDFFGCCFSLSEPWVDVVFEVFDVFSTAMSCKNFLYPASTFSLHKGCVKSAFGYFLFVGRLIFFEFSTPVKAYLRMVVRCAVVVASGK